MASVGPLPYRHLPLLPTRTRLPSIGNRGSHGQGAQTGRRHHPRLTKTREAAYAPPHGALRPEQLFTKDTIMRTTQAQPLVLVTCGAAKQPTAHPAGQM